MELVSIIIPVYNVEKYLNKCIQSVVNQSYKNIEIILVNDGSQDNCHRICDEWAKKDERIKVIHQTNQGLSSARNSGIEIANGDYLCFVDSDDYIDTNYIQILYRTVHENNADMGICRFADIDENNKLLESGNIQQIAEGVYTGKDILKELIFTFKLPIRVVWNKIYKKSLFDNIRFAVGRINEDEFIIHRLIASSDKISVTNKVLYYYLHRNNSIMSSGFNIKKIEYLIALEDRIKVCEMVEKNDCHSFLSFKARFNLLNTITELYFLVYSSPQIGSDSKKNVKTKFKSLFNKYFIEYKQQNKQLNSKTKYSHIPLFLHIFNINPALYVCYKKLSMIKRRLLSA